MIKIETNIYPLCSIYSSDLSGGLNHMLLHLHIYIKSVPTTLKVISALDHVMKCANNIWEVVEDIDCWLLKTLIDEVNNLEFFYVFCSPNCYAQNFGTQKKQIRKYGKYLSNATSNIKKGVAHPVLDILLKIISIHFWNESPKWKKVTRTLL